MAKKLFHYAIWLRDGRELLAVSDQTFYIKMRELKNDRFVEFNGMAIESDLVTFLQDTTPLNVDVVDDPEPERENKKGYTRNIQDRKQRSAEQIEQQNKALVTILAQHGEPMRLAEIIKEMRERGFNWNNNNASGHVKHAIKHGCSVARVGYGLYTYHTIAMGAPGPKNYNLFDLGDKGDEQH